jgi:protein-L-isoaspartate(D-aspartate) O-methyltransferase
MTDEAPREALDAQQEGPDAQHRAQLVLLMRQNGIHDIRVVRAMESVPRRLFVPEHLGAHAYADRALPIACGQTISQPYIVAYMTQQLEVGEGHKVLEIGMGSGYQTAVLAGLARRVYSVDRYRTLVNAAEARLKELSITNVSSMVSDGALGWPAQAPFDRIMVTAAPAEIPRALLEQLAVGGVMIAPVGVEGEQRLVRYERSREGISEKALLPVRFVPLVPGKAAAL